MRGNRQTSCAKESCHEKNTWQPKLTKKKNITVYMQQMDLFSSSKASSSVYITASVGASARKCAFKSHRRKSESWRRSRQSGTRHWRSVVMFSQHMMFEYTSNMSHAALWLPLVGVHFLNTTVWRGGGKTHCKHTRTQRDTHTHS